MTGGAGVGAVGALVPGIVVAGIPILHDAPAEWTLDSIAYDGWRDGRATEPPLVISHRAGDGGPSRPLFDSPDFDETYSVDDGGELVVRFGPRRPGEHQQWMRTVEPGRHYALYYEEPREYGRQQWRWERAILMYALTARGRGMMVHAAAFLAAGGSVLAPGASGAGKSTLAAQVAERLGAAAVLSDDRVAVTLDADGPRAWGTPFYSSGRYLSGADAPLRAIVFPGRSHGGPPALRRVPAAEATPRMLRTLGVPFWSESAMAGMLDTLDAVLRDVPAFEYRYTPGPGAADVLLDGLT